MPRTPAADQHPADPFRASLERSRARRALAARLRDRRRRGRGGLGGLAAGLLAIALAAPLTLAATARTGGAEALVSARSRGAGVTAIQRALGVAESGRYDAATRRAVRAFQRRHGLVVDGIVGPQTRAALGIADAPATATAPAPRARAAASSTLARIAACESGGDPRAVSPDGRYRGKYQFSRATWRALGGHGDPAAAPESVQDAMAARLLARAGTSPWPSCAR